MCTTSEVKLSRTGRTRSIRHVTADHGHQGAFGGRGRGRRSHRNRPTSTSRADAEPATDAMVSGDTVLRHDDRRTRRHPGQRPVGPVEHGEDLAVVDHGHDDDVAARAQERRGTARRAPSSRNGAVASARRSQTTRLSPARTTASATPRPMSPSPITPPWSPLASVP